MTAVYTMSFLFLLLLGGLKPSEPQYDYRLLPAEAIPLPFDETRLAPWAADQSSIAQPGGDTSRVAAPVASDYESIVQFVAEKSNEALEKENEELRQRLDKMEQMLKALASQPPVSGAQSEEAVTDKKSVPGWQVELHPWNKNGRLSKDAKQTILTQNCEFSGRLGQQAYMDMSLYRFMGTFRVKEGGRYVFASDLVCAWGHKCGFNIYVDEQPLVEFMKNTDGERVVNGLMLEPGDHRLEFRTWLTNSSFMDYQPGKSYRWHMLVKGPSDITPRDFEPNELFTVIPRDVNMAARPCAE